MSLTRLLVPVSLALLSACATQPKNNVTVEKLSECPVRLNNGQNMILSLPSNPTTGYRWAIQDSAGGVFESAGPRGLPQSGRRRHRRRRRRVDLALPGIRRRYRPVAPDLSTALGPRSTARGNLRLCHCGEVRMGQPPSR